jgi:hypothetical protein
MTDVVKLCNIAVFAHVMFPDEIKKQENLIRLLNVVAIGRVKNKPLTTSLKEIKEAVFEGGKTPKELLSANLTPEQRMIINLKSRREK